MPGAIVETGDVGRDEIGQDRRDRLAGQVRSNQLFGEKRVALPARKDLVEALQRRQRAD